MQQKFIKNLYQLLVGGIPSLVILLIPFIFSIVYQFVLIFLIIIAVTFFLFFLMGFYWIFQIIVIDTKGIQIKLFKKILRKVEWNEVEDIVYGSVNKGPVYIIKIKEAPDLNIDCRKKIKKSLYYYGNEEIKEMVKKLKK